MKTPLWGILPCTEHKAPLTSNNLSTYPARSLQQVGVFLILFKMFVNILSNIKGNKRKEQLKARENRPHCRSTPELQRCLRVEHWEKVHQQVAQSRGAPWYPSDEALSASPCCSSPTIKGIHLVRSGGGRLHGTDLPWDCSRKTTERAAAQHPIWIGSN